MPVQQEIKRLTAPGICARKGGEPIVCLTSYHAHTARLVDRYCDVRTRSSIAHSGREMMMLAGLLSAVFVIEAITAATAVSVQRTPARVALRVGGS